MTTATPGTTAPAESVTVPVMLAVVCPRQLAATERNTKAHAPHLELNMAFTPEERPREHYRLINGRQSYIACVSTVKRGIPDGYGRICRLNPCQERQLERMPGWCGIRKTPLACT